MRPLKGKRHTTTRDALDNVKLAWPDEAEALEQMTRNAEEWNGTHAPADRELQEQALRIVSPYLKLLSESGKQELRYAILTAIRTPEDLIWFERWLNAEDRRRLGRNELLQTERLNRTVRSRVHELTDVFNKHLRLDPRGTAPRGYVPGPEPTEDDLDLIALKRYLSRIKNRKTEALARQKVAANMLQRDPSRSDREVARTVGMSPTIVGRVRKRLESNGSIPPRNSWTVPEIDFLA